MIKRTLLILLPFFYSILLLSFSEKNKPAIPKATIKTLIIDPGHGGFDPGARGLTSNEADVSLSVAQSSAVH